MKNRLLTVFNFLQKSIKYLISARPEPAEGFERFILKQVQDEHREKLLLKIAILYITVFSVSFIYASNIQLTVASNQTTRMPIAILTNVSSSTMRNVADVIKKDLLFTDQYAPTIKNITAHASKQTLTTALKDISQTTPLALYIDKNNNESHNVITWRLYDTLQGKMIQGKKYSPKNTIVRSWAHAIADEVVKALTGNDGFFSSRIVYCKEHKNNENKPIKHLYVADFDGSNEELLVDNETISIAPRWDNNHHNPRIFYSEYTDTNVQLMTIDMHKNKTVASNLDGVTMLANFSPDGEKSVFCASKGQGNCQLYYQTKKVLKPLTNNNGNNDSPMFIDNDRICFCSDAQTKNPQIYIGNIKTGHIKRITKGGYCTSPSYCPKNNTIAYHKKINNIMQIFVYDCTTTTHTQMTYSNNNKHSASWSPDGTHLMFAQECNNKSYITSLNLATKKIHQITPTTINCSYPHWSPVYKNFPSVHHKTNRQIVSIC